MNGCKILLVDDDPEDHIIMKEAMESLNASGWMEYSSSSSAAIRILTDGYTTGQLPHLIILDLNMPLMNGTETLAMLKKDKRFNNIPVIIFSTSANPLEKEKCMKLGAQGYLIKPSSHTQAVEIARLFVEYCSTVTPAHSKNFGAAG